MILSTGTLPYRLSRICKHRARCVFPGYRAALYGECLCRNRTAVALHCDNAVSHRCFSIEKYPQGRLPATSCGVLKYVLPLPLLECIFELLGKYFCISFVRLFKCQPVICIFPSEFCDVLFRIIVCHLVCIIRNQHL